MTNRAKSSLLALLMVSFVSLFAVGCGNSDNFVATGTATTNNTTPQTGNLVFNFVQAQDTVPTGTTTLRFDFFSSATPSQGTFLFTETRPFASQIIIEDVPAEVQSVVVTAFGANNQPLAVLTGTATVVPGEDSTVDLVFNSNPTFNSLTLTPAPAIVLTPDVPSAQVTVTGNFNTSQVLGQQTSYDVNINPEDCVFSFQGTSGKVVLATANITTSGLVTAIGYGQNDTLSCEYTAFGTTHSDSTLVRTCDLSVKYKVPLIPITGSGTPGFVAYFVDSDGSLTDVSSEVTFSLQTPVNGITVNSTTGEITTNNAPVGTYPLLLTWVDTRTQNPDGSGGTNATFTFVGSFEVFTK